MNAIGTISKYMSNMNNKEPKKGATTFTNFCHVLTYIQVARIVVKLDNQPINTTIQLRHRIYEKKV
jgi:hypothetical protein